MLACHIHSSGFPDDFGPEAKVSILDISESWGRGSQWDEISASSLRQMTLLPFPKHTHTDTHTPTQNVTTFPLMQMESDANFQDECRECPLADLYVCNKIFRINEFHTTWNSAVCVLEVSIMMSQHDLLYTSTKITTTDLFKMFKTSFQFEAHFILHDFLLLRPSNEKCNRHAISQGSNIVKHQQENIF